MESVRDLNMEADDMQVVLSALKGVMRAAVYHPRTLQDYRDRRILPYTQFAGKILYKASDLENMLDENYKSPHV